jgi:hypothetical protein
MLVIEKVNRVDAIRSTSKISPVRPLGSFDELLNQSKQKKKQMSKPSRVKDKNKDTGCQRDKDHIDCNV